MDTMVRDIGATLSHDFGTGIRIVFGYPSNIRENAKFEGYPNTQ